MRRLFAAAVVAVLIAVSARVLESQNATSFDVTEKSIGELQEALSAGTVTSKALVTAYLAGSTRTTSAARGSTR